MFNKNVFTQTDAVADLIKGINEADYKAKMEALKGNQPEIDKNKNNKIDAHDFKILRGEKKVNEEQVEEADTSVKIPTSTGTRVLGHRYGNAAKTHRDSLADPFAVVRGPGQKDMEALGKKMAKKEEIDPNVTTTDTLTGRVAGKSANPFLKAKVKLNVNEEDLDEATEKKYEPMVTKIADFMTRQNRLAAAGAQTAKDPARLKRMMNIPGYSAAMDLAKKTTTKEEVDNLHPAGAALLKHIKPEHHNLYKPHLAQGTFNGSFADRHAVLSAAKQAGHLKEEAKKEDPPFDGPYKKPDTKPGHGDASRVKHLAKMAIPKTTKEEVEMNERSLSPAEKDAVEVNVKSMKKNLAGFKARYGKDAKSVMYATATKQAKKD